jgi:hypothetical protein
MSDVVAVALIFGVVTVLVVELVVGVPFRTKLGRGGFEFRADPFRPRGGSDATGDGPDRQ